MKISRIGLIYCLLLLVTIVMYSDSMQAQDKLLGEVTVNETSAGNSVLINGESVISGRTIMSPADISTPVGTSAKITLPGTGTVLIAPNTKLKLFFVKSGISGDLTMGEVIFETTSGTMLNILTADGTTTLPDKNQQNIVKLTVKNGATRLNTLVGRATFNTVSINAGEYFPDEQDKTPQPVKKSSASNTGLLLILLIGGAAAAAVLGLAAGGGNNNSTPVSPVR